MMLELRRLADSEFQSWDQTVARFADGTVFHTYDWMVTIERLFGIEKLLLGVFRDGQMVGVFPAFRARKGILRVLASPLGGWATYYGGPLVDISLQNTVLTAFDVLLRRERIDYTEIRYPHLSAVQALGKQGYHVEEKQTYVLALDRPIDQLWEGLKSTCRRAVRKAQRSGVEVIEPDRKDFLEDYYELAKDTYRKSNRLPPLSAQQLGIVWDTLKDKDRMKVLLARHAGRTIAGAIFLLFEDKAYYWDGAAYRAGLSMRPNNLIHWTLIEWAASHDYRTYDMLGANMPSIARFKETFGCQLRPFCYAYKSLSWRATLGRAMYRRVMPSLRAWQYRFLG
ncbi:MAG: GNAT family N-acetyltransferase [Chloroflexi bacterium]|nr:MAG: GNAT family N-acetyltransferase [Chloroflexota bacterium]